VLPKTLFSSVPDSYLLFTQGDLSMPLSRSSRETEACQTRDRATAARHGRCVCIGPRWEPGTATVLTCSGPALRRKGAAGRHPPGWKNASGSQCGQSQSKPPLRCVLTPATCPGIRNVVLYFQVHKQRRHGERHVAFTAETNVVVA